MASRIKQGELNDERLFTVRPRTSGAVLPDKRGTPSSIRLNLPNTTENYAEKIAEVSNLTRVERNAFAESIKSEGLGFIQFLLQSVSYNIQEKSQIMHTFGSSEAVYFYGRSPVMVQLTGLIVDDLDNDHFAKFLGLYHKFLRGSRASEEYSYVTLSLPNIEFVGSFMGISIQQNSDRDTDVTFSAQFLAKTFTIRSSDNVFADGEGKFDKTILIRDPDPTITQERIQAIIEANNRAIQLTAERDEENDSNNSFNQSNLTGFFGIVPTSFGKLPTLEGLVGFSAADITDFFDKAALTVSALASPITNFVQSIDGYGRSIMGMIEAVEFGLDDVLHQADSITKQVYGTVETLEDTYTKITSFPASLSSKVGSFGKPGGSPIDIVGSPSTSPSNSLTLLSAGSGVGGARGTPEGEAATLIIKSSSNQALLVPADPPPSEGDTPDLTVSDPTNPSLTPGTVDPEPGDPVLTPGSVIVGG